MVYLSKMVIFHGYVSHNQMVKEITRFGAGYQFKSTTFIFLFLGGPDRPLR